MLSVTVGENIISRKKTKKLSELKIEGLTGIDASNLNKIEHAKVGVTLRTLRKVARALECTLYDLFTEPDGGHATVDRFVRKCIDISPELREVYPDPLLIAWLFNSKLMDKYSIKDIEEIANAPDEEE